MSLRPAAIDENQPPLLIQEGGALSVGVIVKGDGIANHPTPSTEEGGIFKADSERAS